MVKHGVLWIALLAAAFVVTLAAGRFAYFPGDPTLARFVQAVAPASHGWAKFISATAKAPWSFALLTITVAVAWKLDQWRAAVLGLCSFAGMWVLGKWLGPLVARPRPSPELIAIVEPLAGFSFPSIFALTYASTIGFLMLLIARKSVGAWRIVAIGFCCLLLLLGGAARIALGAHWPSDVAGAYLIGFLWAAILVRFV